MAPGHPGLEVPPIGRWPGQVQTVIDLAHEEARALHHDRVDQDHLLLALLHPACPGAARAVLESFGVTAAALRAAWVASMGDPYEPHHRGILFAAGQQPELERANLEALALADAEVASEHVLLALTTRSDRSFTHQRQPQLDGHHHRRGIPKGPDAEVLSTMPAKIISSRAEEEGRAGGHEPEEKLPMLASSLPWVLASIQGG